MIQIEEYQKQVAYLKQSNTSLENVLRYVYSEYYINSEDIKRIKEIIKQSQDQRIKITNIEAQIF